MSKCGNNPTSPGAVAVTSEEFRLLADNMPVMCWIANASGYIYWYNRRWYEYTGATPAQMEGWGGDPFTTLRPLETSLSAGGRRSRAASRSTWCFL